MRAALLSLILLAPAVHAQAPDASWAWVAPGSGIAVALDDGFEAWEAGTGLAGRIETPAYGGRLRADLQFLTYDAVEDVADFWLAVPTLGWGPGVEIGPLRLALGGRVGGAVFQFDDDDAGNLEREIEAAVGGWVGGALRVGRVEVWAEADATRITLSTPTTIVAARAGLALRLGTPRALREVLQ
ncbi:MAG: hypothetical protein AAGK21_06365 [Bacteroidota bacterium]